MGQQWLDFALFAGIVLGVTLLGFIVRNLTFHRLSRWASRTETEVDDLLIDLLRKPFILWSLLLGLWLGLRLVSLPPHLSEIVEKVLLSLFLLSVTFVAGKGAAGLIGISSRRRGSEIAVTSVVQNVVRGVVIAIGLLVLLESLGINIAPLLTVLGVGSLAVALALQDTLSNLFAGIYIALARTIRIEDYIKLDTGQEGYVVDIGWRATRIRTLQNTIIIIPNAKLSQAIVTNFNLPEKHIPVGISISVGYDEDIERVESVALDELGRAMKDGLKGLRSMPEPGFRFIPGFGAYSLECTLTFYVEEFVDQYYVQHEIRKRILKRFRSEGIGMPFPVQTVRIEQSAGTSGEIRKH